MKRQSAWSKAVDTYAKELKADFKERYPGDKVMTEEKLLNGSRDWYQYSWDGNSLIANQDIAERVCSPSELKKASNKSGYVGSRANAREEWMDVQGRALLQAARKLLETERRSKR